MQILIDSSIRQIPFYLLLHLVVRELGPDPPFMPLFVRLYLVRRQDSITLLYYVVAPKFLLLHVV